MFKFLLKNLYSIEAESFGLDISDRSLKFVQLKKNSKNINIGSFGSMAVKGGILENGEIKDEDALANTITELLKAPTKGKLTTKYVSFSLPEEHSFIRVLQLPKMSEEETKEAIKWEIEQNIPLSIDEVYFDWQVMDFSQKQKLDHQDILISAVSKEIADPYVSVIRKAGLINVAIEPESISVVRSVIKNLKTSSPVLVLDLGATIISFIIFSGGSIRFSSSSPLAGNNMLASISKKLNVNEKEARRLFYDVGLDKKLDSDSLVTDILTPILDKVADQVENYISFYSDHSGHDHTNSKRNIEKIVLSGGVANLYGITGYFSSKLGIKTELANPWTNILEEPLNEVPDLSFRKSLRYTTALGLALRGVNAQKKE